MLRVYLTTRTIAFRLVAPLRPSDDTLDFECDSDFSILFIETQHNSEHSCIPWANIQEQRNTPLLKEFFKRTTHGKGFKLHLPRVRIAYCMGRKFFIFQGGRHIEVQI